MKRFLGFALILAFAHALLALVYANATPFKTPGRILSMGGIPAIDVGAPDELQHVVYVERIGRGEGFPVLDPKDPDLGRNYQSHQPPAFYLLAAAWSKVAGTGKMSL